MKWANQCPMYSEKLKGPNNLRKIQIIVKHPVPNFSF